MLCGTGRCSRAGIHRRQANITERCVCGDAVSRLFLLLLLLLEGWMSCDLCVFHTSIWGSGRVHLLVSQVALARVKLGLGLAGSLLVHRYWRWGWGRRQQNVRLRGLLRWGGF